MKKQLLPLLILSTLVFVSCASNTQTSANISDPTSKESDKSSSKNSSAFNPNNGTVKLLKELPAIESRINYNQDFLSFLDNFNSFSASFTNQYVDTYFNPDKNDTISPLSIYFALAQTAACTAGNTRDEIINALEIPENDIFNYSPMLYSATNRIVKDDMSDAVISIEEINNSLWFEKTLKLKDTGIKTLVDSFYCEPYAANFKNEPKKVSAYMSDYISNKTRGLIKPDLDFSDLVRLVIMNTLYMKDQWTDFGNDLQFESKERDFINYDKSHTKIKMMIGEYMPGIAYKSQDFTSFYINTFNRFKLRFMIPNQGKTIDDIFNKENILEMHNADYSQTNRDNLTRCIFPEFTASAADDLNLISMFKERGVYQLFKNADFSNIIEDQEIEIAVTDIKHMTKLIVDKTGVEGAAVTMVVASETAIPHQEEPKYYDFVVDKAFGFEISNNFDIPLFTGIVSKI